MCTVIKIFTIIISFTFVYTKDNGSHCITPNGETATCIPINHCRVIKQAIAFLDESAVEFARKSQCGYEDGPLVCCGTVGRPTTTPAPQTETTSSTSAHNSKEEVKPFDNVTRPLQHSYLPDPSLCGIQVNKRNEKIVGGEHTSIGEFPWMGVIKYVKDDDPNSFSFRCSATLINQRYALTAAQCLRIPGYNATEVRFGEWTFSTDPDCGDDDDGETCADPVVDVPIEEEIPHPYYIKRNGNNDIALLLLAKKVKYTDFVRPVCLPPSDIPPPQPGTEMEITGWGVTENGSLSDVKLKTKVTMKANIDCVLALPDYIHINPNQACAGGDGGRDACNGDSGGPLMRTYSKADDTEDEQWYQEGIIYKGLGCGQRGVPGLYTRITRYITWILYNLEYP